MWEEEEEEGEEEVGEEEEGKRRRGRGGGEAEERQHTCMLARHCPHNVVTLVFVVTPLRPSQVDL